MGLFGIQNNPYELIDTIDGITFLKVDEFKEKIGVNIDDERRILSLILYVMKNLCFQTGDTYLNFDLIFRAFKNVYEQDISNESLEFYLVQLNSMGKIIIEEDKYMSGEVYQFIGKKFTKKSDKNYKNFSDDWQEIF